MPDTVGNDLEPLDLSIKSLETTVPSHCKVVQRSDGSLLAEIWTQAPGRPDVWHYNLVKLPSLYG